MKTIYLYPLLAGLFTLPTYPTWPSLGSAASLIKQVYSVASAAFNQQSTPAKIILGLGLLACTQAMALRYCIIPWIEAAQNNNAYYAGMRLSTARSQLAALKNNTQCTHILETQKLFYRENNEIWCGYTLLLKNKKGNLVSLTCSQKENENTLVFTGTLDQTMTITLSRFTFDIIELLQKTITQEHKTSDQLATPLAIKTAIAYIDSADNYY